jgi:hypothetical protein
MDLEQAIGGVLDLKRRVLEREPVDEHLVEVAPDRMAVLTAPDEHMSREG